MNRHIYNASLAAGVLLTSAGIGLYDPPAGLIAAGLLVLALTLFGARIAAKG